MNHQHQEPFVRGSRNDLLAKFWNRQVLLVQEALGGMVLPGSQVVFIDMPVYLNIGDLMIYLGTERWMESQKLRILGRWTIHNFTFPELLPGATILLQGGGNFGDLYPFQGFRERVVERYPNHRIVFLPQTIHYSDPAAQETTKRTLEKHTDLHLSFRDRRSLAHAREMLPKCHHELSPDMSVHLYPLEPKVSQDGAESDKGVIYLLRKDIEKRIDVEVPDLGSGWTGDWRNLIGYRGWYLRGLKLTHHQLGRIGPAGRFASTWRNSSEQIVKYCAMRFASASHVISSRLHGHLLASLLGVPNTVLDNSYGKNSAYFSTWHRDLPFASLAGNATGDSPEDGNER